MTSTTLDPHNSKAGRKVRDIAFLDGNRLAGMAMTGIPSTHTSPGALFLGAVRDGLLEMAHEMADAGMSLDQDAWDALRADAVDRPLDALGTHGTWGAFMSLQAWTEDLSATGVDPTDVTSSVARAALDAIGQRLFDVLWLEVREAARQDEEG